MKNEFESKCGQEKDEGREIYIYIFIKNILDD